MSFKVLADLGDGQGFQVLAEIADRRVTRVGLRGRTGEAGAMNVVPNQTECVLAFEYAQNDGRPTLTDMDAINHPTLQGHEVEERVDALAELQSSTNTGTDQILEASQARAAAAAAEEDALLARDEAMRAEAESGGSQGGTAGEGEAPDPVPGDFSLAGTTDDSTDDQNGDPSEPTV